MVVNKQKIKFLSNWRRGHSAYDHAARRSRLKGPLSIQIQTVNKCNGSCVMCPYSCAGPGWEPHQMDESLFRRIIEELKELGNANLIVMMLQNEPLLDPRLEHRIRLSREILGNEVEIATVSNGSLLDEKRIESLLSSGLDRIAISIDAYSRETYGKIRRGLSFERVVDNTIQLVRKGKEKNVPVVVRFLRQSLNLDEEKDFIRFWRERGARVSIDSLTNRAGMIKNYDSLRQNKSSLYQKLLHPLLNRMITCCPLPFTSMGILSDGRAILCCHDWEHEEIMGDASRQSLSDIWNGDTINRHRRLLREKREKESVICRGCSLSGRFWGS